MFILKKSADTQKDREYLVLGSKIVLEGELIVNHPTRTINSSFLKKYEKVRLKGKCDDFLGECAEKDNISLGIPIPITGPVYLPFFDLILHKYERRKIRKNKIDLYEHANEVNIQIKKELEKEKAVDRRKVLEIAYILIEELTKELKESLIKE